MLLASDKFGAKKRGDTILNREILNDILNFLSSQSYQGEPILHAIIACDFVSREHMLDALEKHFRLRGNV